MVHDHVGIFSFSRLGFIRITTVTRVNWVSVVICVAVIYYVMYVIYYVMYVIYCVMGSRRWVLCDRCIMYTLYDGYNIMIIAL